MDAQVRAKDQLDESPSEMKECPCGEKSHPPPAVVDAILGSFDEREEFLKNLRYHPVDDFWSFDFAGMFVGVERDGYIHT